MIDNKEDDKLFEKENKKEDFVFELLVYLREILDKNKDRNELSEKELLDKVKKFEINELKTKLDKDFVDYLINCLGLFD